MISSTSDTATSDPAETNPWQEHCQELGEWAWSRLAIKRDRHGIYTSKGEAYWAKSPVTQQTVEDHFTGRITLGLGSTSLQDECLWVAWDLDNHVSDEATNQNLLYAIILRDRLIELGFRPLIEDSDGKGGIHVWVLFYRPIPAAMAHTFAAWMVRDCAQHGLDKIEPFPKSRTVQHTDAKCGNYLRVPGKHHKRDHWSRFWGDGEWLSAEASVQLLLNHHGDDPALIPEMAKMLKMPGEERTRHNGMLPASYGSDCDCEVIVEALNAIPNNDLDYDEWLKIGMALQACDETLLGEFQRWSATSQKHNPQTTAQKWKSFNSNGKVQTGTIFHIAKQHGWKRARQAAGRNQILSEDAEESEAETATEQTAIRSYDNTDRNDIGNSKHFAIAYRDQLRYCVAWGKWLAWDGCRWRIDDEGRPLKLAKELTATMFREAMDHRGEGVFNHVCRTAKLDRLKAMLTLAGPELPIRVSEMDTNHWILNCTNGMVDLRTGKLLPHDRSLSITKLCPTAFHSDSESPLWNKFLRDVFVDDELIRFIQRLFGYFLTGDVSEQVIAILYGDGANGKSTLLTAFMETIGYDYTMQCMPDFLMKKKFEGHPTGDASLFGKRFVSCVETDASRELAESKVKMLTGGERIRARRMNEDFWEFAPTHKLVLCTNHRPVIKGTDEGIWRRLLLVPFLQHFDEARQDKQLIQKLKAESVGILAWAVRGCIEWQRMGLNPPEVVRRATDEYKNTEDVIGRFLKERCVSAPGHSVRFSELNSALVAWCSESGEAVPDKRSFGIRLKERGIEKYTSNGAWYRGILVRGLESPEEVVERTE